MRRGEIWRVRIPLAPGHAQAGDRPALIVQNDSLIATLPTVLIVPFTRTSAAVRFPVDIPGDSRRAERTDAALRGIGFPTTSPRQTRRPATAGRARRNHVRRCPRLDRSTDPVSLAADPVQDRHAVALSSGLRQIGRTGKRMRAASSAVRGGGLEALLGGRASMPVWPIASRTSAAGRQGQVPAAELVGLDPRALRLDVEQPAAVADGQPQLQRQRRRPTRTARRVSSGRIASRNRPMSGMWYIDDRPSYSSWSMTLPEAARNASMHGVVDRGVDDHLGIGPLQRLGPDPAQQGLQRLGMGRVDGDLEDLVVLDEGIAADRLALAGDPDHVGVACGRSSSASNPRSGRPVPVVPAYWRS